ncbi:MAG: ABC transporter permease [Ktedonobacterales bacterium]
MSADLATGTTPRVGAAPLSKCILAQVEAELIMTSRRGENLLVTIIFPLGLLIFLHSAFKMSVDTLLGGVLAVSVMSSGMVSLSIATGYDRYYGVLKRLGSSPLPRSGLVAAKIISLLAVLVVQVVLLTSVAAIFCGWRPAGSFLGVVLLLLLGTATFGGLGMLMAGALRAEATLAIANGLFLFLLLFGGVFAPLPGFAGELSSLLPSAVLAGSLVGALSQHGVPFVYILVLLVWAAIFLVAAGFTFKWE